MDFLSLILYPIEEIAYSHWLIILLFISGAITSLIMILTRNLNAKVKLKDIIASIIISILTSVLLLYISDIYIYFVFLFSSILWELYLLISERNHIMENLISGSMNFALSINYVIYIRMLGLLRESNAIDNMNVVINYIVGYLILLIIAQYIFYIKKISLFKDNWLKDFFLMEDAKVRKNRYMLIFSILLLVFVSMSSIYAGVEVKNIFINLTLTFFSLLLTVLFFLIIKFIVEYCILHDKNINNVRYQQNLEQFMKVIRAQRHDFNSHLHAIKGLIDNDNFTECREYVTTIVGDSNSINDVLPIKNPIISAMIHGFREKSESSGIHMYLDITYDMSKLAVTAYDLNRILGNLIQNAIDEISKNKDNKYGIHICISKDDDMTVLDVSNRFSGDGNINKIFNAQYTTKRRHEGIGLSTVLKIAQSYDGIIYPEIDDDIIHFIVRLPNETD